MRYTDVLEARLTIDLADLLDNPKPGKVLRNAWANVRVHYARVEVDLAQDWLYADFSLCSAMPATHRGRQEDASAAGVVRRVRR